MSQSLLDARFYKLSLQLLKKYGGTATYHDVTAGYTDQTTGAYIPPSEIDIPISTYKSKANYGEIQAGLVTASQAVFLISQNGFDATVKDSDFITFNSEKYKVISNLPVMGGQQLILNRVVCESL